MKYVVLTITTLLYVLAGAAIAFGLTRVGRAVVQVWAYEPAMAEPVERPGDPGGPYGFSVWDLCWEKYEYHVDGRAYLGPRGCTEYTSDRRIRVLYKRNSPGESILDNTSTLIKDGLFWVAFGGVLGWWASTWRSRSVALHGRAASVRRLSSGAWGLIALLGVAVLMARDIADTHEGFCGSRRAMLSGSIARFVSDHERRFPRDWLKAFRANVDDEGVLTGSPECLAVMRLEDLARVCAGGFHIIGEANVGSPVCDLSGSSRYKVDIEFLTDRRNQTVNVRFLEAP